MKPENMTKEIKIPYSNLKIGLVFIGALAFVVISVMILMDKEGLTSIMFRSEILNKVVAVIAILFFGTVCVTIPWKLFQNNMGLIINDKGIMVAPDILANAGGVTVSYFEWVQGLQWNFWELEDVRKALHRKMTKAFYDVIEIMEEHNTDMRTAAYVIAIKRVATATKLRGIYP